MSINENDDVELTSYTSESTAAAEAPVASERPALTVPGSAVGRRKEAVARVRLVPGSCLLYTSPSPRDGLLSRMPSSA